MKIILNNEEKEILTNILLEELNRIKDVLDSRGISQTWLAKQLDMDFSSINAYCSQRLQPSIKTLIKIGEVLNLDFKELITDKDDRNIQNNE